MQKNGGIKGSDHIQVPGQTQNLGEANGSKTVKDLIGADANIDWTGTKGEVTGTVNFIADYSSLFPVSEKSGHFFPVKFEDKYLNQNITVGSQNGKGGKDIRPTQTDPYLIIRLENVTVANKISAIVKDTQEEIFELDFSKATQVPAVTVIPQEYNFEEFHKNASDLVNDDVKINAKGEVTGTLPFVEGFTEFSGEVAKQSGHYIPVRVDSQYTGKNVMVKGTRQKTVLVSEETDRDWILYVASTSSKFTFSVDGNVFMTLTFTGADLQAKS